MAELRSRFMLAACLMAVTAMPAAAIAPTDDTSVFEVPLETPEIIQSPTAVPGVAEITGQLNSRLGGDWHVHLWNPDSNTPEAITGTGIQLSGSVADDAGAAAAARSFVAQQADLLRVSVADLEVERVVRGMGKIAVHFEQRFHGVPVQGGRVMTFFNESGRVSIFGSTFYSGINLNPVPTVGAASATAIATRDLPFNPATDRVLVEPELLVLPKHRDGQSPEYHLVWRTTVGTAEPYGAWVTYIDAHSTKIVARVNDVHSAYSGTSQGDVDQTGYCDGQQTSPFRNMFITVSGLGNQTTDINGQFTFAGTGGNRTLTAQFNGTIVNVNDVQFGDATVNTTIQENVPLTVNWTDATPSRRSERDVFYYVNATNAFIKGIDPAWNIPSHTASVNVNATCNANWTTWHMNFFREGGGCPNTGTVGDIVAHEYGHGIQFTLIGGQGNEGLGEGNADIAGTFISDDFVVGRGWNLNQCNSGLRSCLHNLQYPADVVGQPIHNAGRVICGFNWDARVLLETKLGQAAGEAHTAMLWHFGRKLFVPTNQPAQVLSYFAMDDDDANLGNGSPNRDEICEAAENHGFSCPTITEGVAIIHTPLTDTASLGPYAVTADIQAFGPHGLNTSSCELHYSINGGAYSILPMGNVGGNNYQATIPAVATGTAVAYWITAETVVGTPGFYPPDAPEDYVLFGAGIFNTNLTDDIELDQGWTVTENASDGTWERADPNGTFAGSIPVNPADDHTPNPGVICWVTGNPPPGSIFFIEELDGSTSVRSPNLDMTNCNLARGSLWLWLYSNSGEDAIDVDASSDGGNTWVTVRRVEGAADLNQWIQYNFTLSPFDIDFTSTMRIRVRGQDLPPDTIVDCGFDDFVIRSLQGGGVQAINPPQASVPVSYALLPSSPNPFNPSTEIRYELPRDEQVKLTVFDVTGRELSVLVDEAKNAGAHSVSWNGTDREGRAMPSGVYFYRLEAGSYTQTHRMTLLK